MRRRIQFPAAYYILDVINKKTGNKALLSTIVIEKKKKKDNQLDKEEYEGKISYRIDTPDFEFLGHSGKI